MVIKESVGPKKKKTAGLFQDLKESQESGESFLRFRGIFLYGGQVNSQLVQLARQR